MSDVIQLADHDPNETSHIKSVSGFYIYSGDYLEREISTRLNTPIKRHGTEVAYGEIDQMKATDAIINLGCEVMVEPILSGAFDISGEDEGVPSEVVDFVWNALMVTLQQPFRAFARQALLSYPLVGFGPFEEEWQLHDDLLLPARFHQMMPWTIDEWNVEHGRLRSIRQWQQGATQPEPIPADQLTLFVHDQQGDDYRGNGLYRRLHPLWYTKQELMKARIIGHNRALGVPYAKWTGEAGTAPSKPDDDDVQETLQNMRNHESSWFSLPTGYEYHWFVNEHWSDQASEIREDIKELNGQILLAFKGAFLGLGMIGEGARAVGETQSDPFYLGVEALSREFTDTLNGTAMGADHTGIIRRIVDRNFPGYAEEEGGKARAYPKLRISGIRAKKVIEVFKALESLQKSGQLITQKIIEVGYNALGIDPPTDKEFQEGKAEQAAKAQKEAEQRERMQQSLNTGHEEESDTPPEDDEEIAASISLAFHPSRPLKELEKFVALAEIDTRMNLGVTEFEARTRRVLLDHADAIAEEGESAEPALEKALTSTIDELATDIAQEGSDEVEKERERMRRGVSPGDAAEPAQRGIVSDREDAGIVAAEVPGAPDDILKAELEAAIEASADDLMGSIRRIRLAIRAARGLTEAEKVSRIKDAILSIGDATIRKAGLGLTTTAFNIGRDAFAKSVGPEVVSVQVSEVMDANTCGPCSAHDGLEFPFGSPEHAIHQAPFSDCQGGSRCREILIYNFGIG